MGRNRSKVIVQTTGLWRLYQHTVPPGWQMLGTVQVGHDIGALGQSSVGVYAQLNAGVIRPLDQGKVRAALGQS